jgi:hypothetical protein
MFAKIAMAVGILLFIMLGQWAIETLGEQHYEIAENNTIFDLAHKLLPDIHEHEWIINVLPVVLVMWMVVLPDSYDMLKTVLVLYMITLSIRALTAVSTILPKHEKCQVGSKFLNIFQGGGCYDKIFSGHAAFVTLLLLVLLKAGHISALVFWLLLGSTAFAILATRSHYTVDVVLGILMSYLVFDGKYDTRIFRII